MDYQRKKMNYSETLVPLSAEEKKKQVTILIIVLLLPVIFTGVGYLLKPIDFLWAIFCWIGAAVITAFLLIPKIFRFFKDDFFSHKIVYKGTIQEINTIKMGFGTSSSLVYELVLEKKTLKISEKELIEIRLVDIPFPAKGEEVEIHALPRSGDIIKLLVKRNEKWECVELT